MATNVNKLNSPDSLSANFGSAIAISGDTIVVGEPYANSQGLAHVYTYDGADWILEQTLTPSYTHTDDAFGASVAIDGDVVVVGAPYNGYDDTDSNFVSNAGTAFVFERSGMTWSETAILTGFGSNGRIADDNFGQCVAVKGSFIAVGSYNGYDESGANFLDLAGSIFVFEDTGSWITSEKIVTDDRQSGDFFGCTITGSNTIAMYSNKMVAGAPGQSFDANQENEVISAGALYVFAESSGWTQQQKLTTTSLDNNRLATDSLGLSVAMYDNLIVAGSYNSYDAYGSGFLDGAGSAFVFEYIDSTWQYATKLVGFGTNGRLANDQFGSSVAVYKNIILCGCPQQDYNNSGGSIATSSGATYIIKYNTNWYNIEKISAFGTNSRSTATFGSTVAIDGTHIVCGAPTWGYDISDVAQADTGAVFTFLDINTPYSYSSVYGEKIHIVFN